MTAQKNMHLLFQGRKSFLLIMFLISKLKYFLSKFGFVSVYLFVSFVAIDWHMVLIRDSHLFPKVNVCVPQIHMRTLTPNVMTSEVEALEVIRSWRWCPPKWLWILFMRKGQKASLFSFQHMGHRSLKSAPGKKALIRTRPHWHLISDV